MLIADASERAYGKERERKLFYTACTRAMHRLRLYAAGAPSPFQKTVDPEDYLVERLETFGIRHVATSARRTASEANREDRDLHKEI